MKKIYLLLLIILFLPIYVRAEECEIKPVYHISFDTNTEENISKMSVTEDISLPVLSSDSSNFLGWYYDEDLTIKADITKSSDIDNKYYVKISSTECEEYYELKLYAKWEKICDSDVITHHIIYVTNTSEKISKLSIPIDKSKEVTFSTPTRSGYKFMGWYYDKDFKNKVNVKTYSDIKEDYFKKVSSTECNDFYEMKIYAKWSKINTSNSNEVKSNSNSNSNNIEDNSNKEETPNIESNSNINKPLDIEKKDNNKNNNIVIYIGITTLLVVSVIGFIIYKKRK